MTEKSDFKTIIKLSDSIVENQYAMYTGSSKLEELKQNAVIRLKEFVVAGTADKAIIHISDMDILHTAAVSREVN